MAYKINSTDLSTFGIIPIQQSGQTLAVTGVFDFPARKGETERSWGTETEAFVAEADLKWTAREIAFKGLMKAATKSALLTNLENFNTLCKSAALTFETRVGTFTVYLTGEIEVVILDDTTIQFDANFTEPEPQFLTAPGTPSGGSGYLLEGYNLRDDFGIILTRETGKLSTPERIEINTTEFYINSGYRQPKDLKLGCIMMAADLSDLTTKIGKLHGLLSQPRLKTLTYPDGATAETYIKSGFKVSGITEGGKAMAAFTLTLRKP